MEEIAVIGGGASGALVCHDIVEGHYARGASGPLLITVFEPRPSVGLGRAWSPEAGRMLCNMPAPAMNLTGEPDDGLRRAVAEDRPGFEARVFLPRRDIGTWLSGCWEDTVAKGTQLAIAIAHDTRVVAAVRQADRGFRLTLADGAEVRADRVLMAVGNIPTTYAPNLMGNERYINDPGAIEDLCAGLPQQGHILEQIPLSLHRSRRGRCSWRTRLD